MNMNFDWTPAHVETLRKMAAEGHTALRIGQTLGATRNAVIGKCGRLKIKLGAPVPLLHSGEFIWTGAADAKLREMWLAGLSLTEICRQLGVRHQASISAHAKRIGLPKRSAARQSMTAVNLNAAQARARKPAPAAAEPELPPFVPPPGAVAFLDARFGQCRWPLWPDTARVPMEQKFFCGAPCGPKSYCAEHATRSAGIGSLSERNAHMVAA